MIKFKSYASSSKGNAYTVSNGDTTLLIECGITFKQLQKKLDYKLSEITACLVSHEHSDHSKCALQLIKHGIPVYMSYGTAEAHKDFMDGAKIIKAGQQLQLGSFIVVPITVYHNTAEPLGFIIVDLNSQDRLLFVIDSVNINYLINGLTHVAIECNYDDSILSRLDMIDETRKQRVRNSHMEINTCLNYLHKLDLSKCRQLYLMHLSKSSSSAWHFKSAFEHAFPNINVVICEE